MYVTVELNPKSTNHHTQRRLDRWQGDLCLDPQDMLSFEFPTPQAPWWSWSIWTRQKWGNNGDQRLASMDTKPTSNKNPWWPKFGVVSLGLLCLLVVTIHIPLMKFSYMLGYSHLQTLGGQGDRGPRPWKWDDPSRHDIISACFEAFSQIHTIRSLSKQLLINMIPIV